MEDKFTFFWNGPFSQWSIDGAGPTTQFYCDGEEFCCAEQWMMACKAHLFGDQDVRRQIMATLDPREHKALGRQVSNFDEDEWNKYAKDIVYQGNILKFSQNYKYRAALESTVGTTLVEASPYDKIWGIGLSEDDPKALNSATWNGKNLLGYILTEVREVLMYGNTA